jgi:ribonuclease D
VERKVVPIRPDITVETSLEQLAQTFNYVHTKEQLDVCCKWVSEQPYVSLDIETAGKNKNEATLHTKATVRLITLHAGEETWFVDCDHLDDADVSRLLELLVDKPKYLHNSTFDIPRLYRRFGVLLNKNVKDTLIASRCARAGEWEEKHDGKKVKRPTLDFDLAKCLNRELGIEIPKVKQKWMEDLTPEHLTYAADDVQHLKELYEVLERRIDELGIRAAYDAISRTTHMFLGVFR